MKPETKPEWNKLPAIVETTSFRKTSDDYTFTIATPRKYEEYAKAFMARLSGMGVLFFIPCAPDQVDALLRDHDAPAGITDGAAPQEVLDSCVVPVETMAQVLGVDVRTVQLDAEKGVLVRTGRGLYDALASCGTLRKAWKETESGKNDAYNEERTAAMRLKRLEREREHEEAMKRLVEYEGLVKARERKNADMKQKLLFLEKTLPPRLHLLPANEQETIIKHEIRKLLTEFALIQTSIDREALADAIQEQTKQVVSRKPATRAAKVAKKAKKK
jgi:hypothetical protein